MDRMGSILGDGLRGDFVDDQQAKSKKADVSHNEFNLKSQGSHSRDWSKSANSDVPEVLDLEAALRMDDLERPRGESSGSSGK